MAIVKALGAFASAITAKLAAEEIKAWLPRLTRWLLDRAIRRLPENERARYTEEWESDLLNIPGDLSRVIYAIDLARAASGICGASKPNGISFTYTFAKRSFDLLFSFLVLPCSILPLTILCPLVWLDSPGPIFFKQKRVGKNGQPFVMYKLRTCYTDDRGVIRITRLGSVLRRFSLDELPQYFSVLTGHMSVIGPRPCLPSEYAKYTKAQRRRVEAVPGITGLWQVEAGTDPSWETYFALDLYYVENRSFGLDMKILWRTVLLVSR